MSVRVFVEGGGDQRRTLTACRKAFSILFAKLLGDRPKPRVVACGSRDEAYRDFSRSLGGGDVLPVLLVDSEDPVPAGKTVAQHLRDRDHWTNPLPNEQVHLMVQCMEAWFLTDQPTLLRYYGPKIRTSALPANRDVENVPKRDILQGLAQATRDTTKGAYHKTRHAFEILESLDPESVRRGSQHAAALFAFLVNLADETSP